MLIAIFPATLAYFGAVYQYKSKLALAKERNETELNKVIKQLQEDRYKTDKEIEKLKLEKDNDIERIKAETNKEISILQAQNEANKEESFESKIWDGMGEDMLQAFKKNIDLDKLVKDGLNKNK